MVPLMKHMLYFNSVIGLVFTSDRRRSNICRLNNALLIVFSHTQEKYNTESVYIASASASVACENQAMVFTVIWSCCFRCECCYYINSSTSLLFYQKCYSNISAISDSHPHFTVINKIHVVNFTTKCFLSVGFFQCCAWSVM